jgi:hypothetical protein
MKKLLLFFITFYTLTCYAQFPENFENAAILNNDTPPAAGWRSFNNGIGANVWIKTTSFTPRGTASARISRQTVSPPDPNFANSLHWLVSPIVTVPANGQVRFYTKKASPSVDYNGELEIRISTLSQTDPTTFSPILGARWNESQISTSWEQKFVLLTAYVGQPVYIAFVKKNASGDTWLVDDIKVDSQCLTPTALTAAPFATSATLSWDSPNVAGPWQIEYGPVGFLQGTTDGTIVNVTSNPYNLTC